MAGMQFNINPGIVSATAALTVGPEHNGRQIVLNLAGGFTSTLPTATGGGARYRFMVGTVSTTGYVIKVNNTTDVIGGTIFTLSDGAAAVLGYMAVAATSDTITLNGTTTGGVSIGDWVEIVDVASGVFAATGLTTSSGTEATPFSATV
jgi:hypothetical protein